MMKLISILCLLLITVHQSHADCQDIDRLCREHFDVTIPYDCDRTCTKFVVCFYMLDNLKGLLKTCPNGMYYDSSRKICSKYKPEHCL